MLLNKGSGTSGGGGRGGRNKRGELGGEPKGGTGMEGCTCMMLKRVAGIVRDKWLE